MKRNAPNTRASIVSVAMGTLLVGFVLLGTGCPPPPPACATDADCDNGLFCDGAETCVETVCVDGTSPCAEGETCDEDNDECIPPGPTPCQSDEDCAEGEVCNLDTGECEAAPSGCTADADCAEGEVCNLDTGECEAAPAGCTSDADCADVEGDFCVIQTGECVVSADVFGATRTDFATIHAPAPHAACTVCHHPAGDGVPDATAMSCLTCHADDPNEANSFKTVAHDLDEDGNGCRQCHFAEFDSANCGFCHPDYDALFGG